jgi:hypothetical protein
MTTPDRAVGKKIHPFQIAAYLVWKARYRRLNPWFDRVLRMSEMNIFDPKDLV